MGNIEKISSDMAEKICREIMIDLPEYFGQPEINAKYAIGVKSRENFVAMVGKNYAGLISIDFPYPNNCSIYWLGVFSQYHSRGFGGKLVESAVKNAELKHASTMTVETLDPCESDENYLKTYEFYKAKGFKPLVNIKPGNYRWSMVYMARIL